MVSPMIRRTAPTGERLFMADQQARHPTPIRRLSLMEEPDNDSQNLSNMYASPMGMTIVPPDDISGSISHLDAPSAMRELTEIENTLGSMSARRGRRGGGQFQPLPLQHTPLPPSSALVIPGSHSKMQVGSASSKKSRSRRSVSGYWGENEDPTEREVKVLQARFSAIQAGLGSIDNERERLVEKSKELEDEKMALEKQLQLRDNEIHALVRRCAKQEETMREYSTIRSQNRELATNLESMVNKLESMKASSTGLHDLKRQLSESEHAREELQKRLEWVEKEHDAIATTLKECLENIRKLTAEKQQLEEDRIRERKRSEMEMEQQRLNMVQISNDLQSDLQQKQQQIDEMELIIQQQNLKRDTASTMSSASHSVASGPIFVTRYDDHLDDRKGSFDSEIMDASLKKTVQRYEKQIADMKMQVESHMEQIMVEEEQKRQQAANEYERQIELMRKELLQNGSNEGRMFELQSKLAEQGAEMAREKESSHQVREAAERYEKTISGLNAMLEEKTKEVEDTNEANTDLQAQIARNEMDLQSQVKNIKKYEEKVDDLEKLLFEQEQELQSSEETFVKSTEKYEEKVSELEKRLREQQQQLQSSQDSCTRMQEINGEKEALASTHEIRITQMQTQISQQEIELQTRANKIAALESKTQEHAQMKNALAEHETNTTLLQTLMKQKETELQFTQTEYESRSSWYENELTNQRHAQMALEAENRVLMDTKNDLTVRMNEIVITYENKMRDLQGAKDEVETKLNEIVSTYENKVRELQGANNEAETKLNEIVSTYENKVRDLQGAKNEVQTKLNEVVVTYENKVRELQGANNEAETKLNEIVSTCENKVRDLQGAKNEVETKLNEIAASRESEVENLQCAKNEIETKLNEVVANHENEVKDLQDAKNEIETKLNEVVANHENEVKDLQDAKSEAETKLNEVVANCESEVKHLQDAKSEAEKRVKDLESTFNDKLKDLQGAKEQAENRLDELVASNESKVKNLESSKNEVETKMKELENELKSLQGKMVQRETELCRIEDESSNLLANLKKCEKKLEEQGEILNSREEMNEKLKEMKKEGDDMTNQLMATHEMTIASLNSNIEQKDLEIESKDQAVAEYERKIVKLNGQLVRRENAVKTLQAKIEEDAVVIKSKCKEAASNEAIVADLKQRLDKQTEEKAEVEKNMEQMLAEHTEKMAEVLLKTEKLRNKLVEMKDKLDEREERISNLESEFSAQMQELMNKQVILDRVEDRGQQLEAQIETLQHFENEHAAMVHYIEIMESNCAELTAENGILNVEKESLIEDKIQLQEKLEGFQGRVTTLREKHVSREAAAKEDLRQEVVKLQEGLEAANRQLATKAEEVTKVRMETKLTLENMQVSLEKARDEIVELEDQLGWEKSLQTQPTDASEEIESLTHALEAETRRCEALQDKIDTLLMESESMQIEIYETSAKLKRQEQERARLQEEFEAAQEEIALQEQELERRDKRIGDLVSEIDTLNQNDREEAFIETESQKLELERQLAEMRRRETELFEALETKDSEIENIRSYCSELEEKTASLGNQLLLTEEDLMEKLNVMAKDIAEKEEKLSGMRGSIADKNAQIESLMSEMKLDKDQQVELLGKLSNSESKIASFETELERRTEKIATLEKQAHGANDSTSLRISDLEKQIHRMKTELALKDDEIRDLRMVDLKDAEEEISELKASLESKRVLEQELLSKRSLFMEQQQTINDLKMSQTRLLTRERDLMEECDRLYESEKEAKKTLSEMERERKNFVSDLRSKKLSQECELRKLEQEASERDDKLSEVVSLNEGLEKRLALKENELLEERQELDSKRGEITRLRREFLGKETSLKLQLKEQRRSREVAEQTLESMKRQKSEASKYKKQVSENEKEIEGLKDKVKRQEAYMQTRIQREKISTRTAAVATPKRASPQKPKSSAQSLAASHLARRRQSGIPSKPSNTEGAVSTHMSTPAARRKARASLLPLSAFKSPGFRSDLD